MQPVRPTNLSEPATACLAVLVEAGLAGHVSIGGALGLLHYHNYRTTHDIDAWWEPAVTSEQQQQVIAVLERTLARYGQVRRRQWGDVTCVDIVQSGNVGFSFQIARRSVRLEPSVRDPAHHVLLDSLNDLIASKMVALVERGAPRDFRDIHEVCASGLGTPAGCWALWKERQTRSGGDSEPSRAKLAVETHLQRIAQHRPLASIDDARQRGEAERVRRWFREVLLNAL